MLERIHEKGIHIIFATRRDYKKLNEVLGTLAFECLAICCKGAEVYNCQGNLKFYNILNLNVQSDILQYLEKQDILYIVYTQKVNFVRKIMDKNAHLLILGRTVGKSLKML